VSGLVRNADVAFRVPRLGQDARRFFAFYLIGRAGAAIGLASGAILWSGAEIFWWGARIATFRPKQRSSIVVPHPSLEKGKDGVPDLLWRGKSWMPPDFSSMEQSRVP